MVGEETSSERANSDAFRMLPCQCATIIQNRRMVPAAKSMPNAGRSRSRKVVTYALRQMMLSESVPARYAGG